ncbi:hypothetical protein [Nodularia sp. UHCC 0506]|uniref:hypothetical protein n=1 Tax=Nodularia sp. UHCC 0506 TaxID=3110243 RepID=UPI002B2075F7|nr:hypothetical protein [Nodularia sp. UHCC 0506]MEA5516209.1 hypothetical protein [Nodularia sp. UHCC 0506]
MHIIILSAWLILMISAVLLAISVLQTAPKSKRKQKTSRRRGSDRPAAHIKTNSRKWKELVQLLHGDVDTANRLVQGEKMRNPNRSADWCVDKALWQLERDRRG